MRMPSTLLLITLACGASEPTPGAAEASRVEPSATVPTPAAVDPRDQYALLAAIEATVGDALTRDAGAMASVRADWQGRRYRWEVAFVPLFCRTAQACHVGPFDHGRLGGRRIQQGWMPQLELDAAGLAELVERCAGRPVCVLDIEATMREFVFDPEFATAVRFADVRVHGARDAAPAESWMTSRAPIRGRT